MFSEFRQQCPALQKSLTYFSLLPFDQETRWAYPAVALHSTLDAQAKKALGLLCFTQTLYFHSVARLCYIASTLSCVTLSVSGGFRVGGGGGGRPPIGSHFCQKAAVFLCKRHIFFVVRI